MRSIECPQPFWRHSRGMRCTNLYFGENLLESVPQEAGRSRDWWSTTALKPLDGHAVYLLDFPGINYLVQIWPNRQMVADNKHVAGMLIRCTS